MTTCIRTAAQISLGLCGTLCFILVTHLPAQTGTVATPTISETSPTQNTTTVPAAQGDWNFSSTSSMYLRVLPDPHAKLSKAKPGDIIEGKLSQGVYVGDRELIPANSRIHLTVQKLERRRRVPNDHWPWVINAFTPRHQNSPVFESATVTLPDGKEVRLRVQLISIADEKSIRQKRAASPSSGSNTKAKSAKTDLGPVLSLEAQALDQDPPAKQFAPPENPFTLAAGTSARIVLLGSVSASRSHPGDTVQARLVEPLRDGPTIVVPAGATLVGEVVKSQHPRMLSRAGSLLLRFTSLRLPDGTASPIAASISGLHLNQRSHTTLDAEGNMKGDHPGKAWMLLNVGATAGLAKAADDGLQLVIEAIVSTATDVSTAGTGRIAATAVSAIFLATRHGRDVVLPKFAEVEIVLDRPVTIPGSAAN